MPRLSVLPPELHPIIRHVAFPPELNVEKILALNFLLDRLWIVADGLKPAVVEGANSIASEFRPFRVQGTDLWSYDPETGRLSLSTDKLLTNSSPTAVYSDEQDLWITDGEGISRFGNGVQRFGPENGLPRASYEWVSSTEGAAFANGGLSVHVFQPAISRWSEIRVESLVRPIPNTNQALDGSRRWIFIPGAQNLLYDPVSGISTSLNDELFQSTFATSRTVTCSRKDGSNGLWLGSECGLHFLNPGNGLCLNRCPPLQISTSNPLFGGSPNPNLKRKMEEEMGAIFKRWFELRSTARDKRLRFHRPLSPLTPTTRLPGRVSALAPDGDFLWVASGNEEGWYVLLLHRPSASWLGQFKLSEYGTHSVPALGVSQKYLWVGLQQSRSLGFNNPLLQIEKTSLTNIPPSQWMPDTIVPAELSAVEGWPNHEQAIDYFFSGDYEKVIRLLPGEIHDLDLEELYLLGHSYDSLGLNESSKARKYFEEMIAREGASPWGTEARQTITALESKLSQ